jgi:hypothetical protein
MELENFYVKLLRGDYGRPVKSGQEHAAPDNEKSSGDKDFKTESSETFKVGEEKITENEPSATYFASRWFSQD